MKAKMESTIHSVPQAINDTRDKAYYYNAEGASDRSTQKGLLKNDFDNAEMIPDQLCKVTNLNKMNTLNSQY